MSQTICPIVPPLPVETPKGHAMAHFLLDYGFEHYLMFVCFVDESGECWVFDNRKVKMQKNEPARPSVASRAEATTWMCPHCGEEDLSSALGHVCKPKPEPSPVGKIGIWRCPDCHHEWVSRHFCYATQEWRENR